MPLRILSRHLILALQCTVSIWPTCVNQHGAASTHIRMRHWLPATSHTNESDALRTRPRRKSQPGAAGGTAQEQHARAQAAATTLRGAIRNGRRKI